jgi:DNA-directed RNA polymerase specialized sigma24 family protein
VDDRQAFDLMKSSEQIGLESLIDKYGATVDRVIKYVLGRNSEDVHECSDHVWFSVWQQASQYDENISSAKTWVCITKLMN